ncbi:murein biosynthesis integral membrane protein MurJ [Persephonella sp.]
MKNSHFLKNTLLFSVATLISRVLGYIRDATVAYFFGANALTDAFFVAWRIPNTLRQLVAEGSFNAAFIPIYTQTLKEDPETARLYSSSLFSFYTLILSFVVVFVVLFSDFFVSVVAPGLSEKGTLDEASKLLKIVFPYVLLVGWVSFFMALLNTKDRFFIPAVSPALLNLSFIMFAFLFAEKFGIYALAYGAVFGGVLQVLLQVPFLVREGLMPSISFKILPQLKETLNRLLPAFASFGVSQFAFIIDTVIASFLLGGAISYLYYANRIFQLPIGLFAVGLGNALLVSLSRHYSDRNADRFNEDFNAGLRFAIFISVPASAGMLVLGKEILSVLLERGEFTHTDTYMTYLALIGYALGLTAYALARPYKSAFFAVGDTKTPLYSTIAGLLAGIVSAVVAGFMLKWGVFGLALASSISGFVSLIHLGVVSDFPVHWDRLGKTLLKTAVSTGVMVLTVVAVKWLSDSLYFVVLAGITFGAVVYFLVSYILKEQSAVFMFDKLRKKF